ncbi:NADPH:quinone oxidoreductase family protein [Pseudorhodoplanes sp.]|uniref:NADPH:quinone oxidoreductase family protein n=1 Tax=Pseudorhodoplanes sp. TaxID=1934341 RepID=UPI002C3E435A|nr:NADPH:quinone oxidoreductase family protein [Pseudorhodoplanes sp.]HWV53747.1 NADPH:quinone oxidoreductase family protein [Pseudorhodoplanes sp.]
MKAIICRRYGTADDLELYDLPEPEAGEGEVVVKVAAAALNFFDTLLIAGKYQVKPDFPFSPAAEFAGTVHEVGPGVTGFEIGDRVMSYAAYGAAREYYVQKASRLVKVPDSLDLDRAAGLSVTYGTTIHALKDRAKLKAGETLAVLGAAGGTGLAAVEIGKLMGARVIACASSDEKCAFAKKHGADETINYAANDLRAELKRLGGRHGIDVIYDPVGDRYAEPALRSMAWAGRYLVIGFAAGEIPKIPLNLVLLKSCDIVGVHWGAFVARDPEAEAANMNEIVRWCADGKLSAHVHAVYPLSETAQALKDIAARKIMGKAILKP